MNEPKKTVVVFEDGLAAQVLLNLFFAKKGYETRIYGDGENAVARVRENAPALIMMDLMMPGADGFTACEDIRQTDKTTPIVVLSVKADAQDRERALGLGANAYLVKPFNPAQLEAVIAPLLGL
jgi:two-component system response regulator RstA